VVWLIDANSTLNTAMSDVSTSDNIDHKHHSVDSGKRFACNDCEFTTKHSGHYKRHINKCHRGTLTSEHCETSSVSADDLKKTCHNSTVDQVPCPCYEEKFDTATTLDGHLRDDHDVKENTLYCHSCSLRSVAHINLNFKKVSIHMASSIVTQLARVSRVRVWFRVRVRVSIRVRVKVRVR